MELFWLNAAFTILHQALGSQVGRHARANEHARHVDTYTTVGNT